MKLLRTATLVLIVILCPLAAHASVLFRPATNPANGHDYYLLDQAIWEIAEAEALTLGGHLATINDAAEDQFVFDTFSPLVPSGESRRSLYIGLSDATNEGVFLWSSGEVTSYENWGAGQPQSEANDEDYVGIALQVGGVTTGKWHDIAPLTFEDVTFGVAEVPPNLVPTLGAHGPLALALAFLSCFWLVMGRTAQSRIKTG